MSTRNRSTVAGLLYTFPPRHEGGVVQYTEAVTLKPETRGSMIWENVRSVHSVEIGRIVLIATVLLYNTLQGLGHEMQWNFVDMHG